MYDHHRVLWSVERHRLLSRTAAEDEAIRQALAERNLADVPQRASESTWRRFLRHRTGVASRA